MAGKHQPHRLTQKSWIACKGHLLFRAEAADESAQFRHRHIATAHPGDNVGIIAARVGGRSRRWRSGRWARGRLGRLSQPL